MSRLKWLPWLAFLLVTPGLILTRVRAGRAARPGGEAQAVLSTGCAHVFLPLVFQAPAFKAGGPPGDPGKYPLHPADYNGDGCADLAIGAPGQQGKMDTDDVGVVTVVYGSLDAWSGGFAARALWVPMFQAGNLFGSALAYGDFNHDGYSDLAVGAPGETVDGDSGAGVVHIFYGSESGLPANPVQSWDQGVLLNDPEPDDAFGSALAVGDFDGDGYDDLAVGAPGESDASTQGVGGLHLIYGSEGGLTSTGNEFLWQDDLNTGDQEAFDNFGAALAAGDFDRDGFDDLAVGTPLENILALTNPGWVDVLYGSATGPEAQNQFFDQNAMSGETSETGDEFGAALTVGDFNGDGYADLAIGAPGETLAGQGRAGTSHVVYGSATGLSLAGDQQWDQNNLFGAVAADDELGASLVAGDFDGDGYDELGIGVPGKEIVAAGAGLVHVIHGAEDGLDGNQAGLWHQDSPGIAGEAEAGDAFGHALTAGDYNRDGYADLVVGAPHDDYGTTNVQVNAGEVNVIFGTASGLDDPGNVHLYQQLTDLPGTSETGDWFGLAVR